MCYIIAHKKEEVSGRPSTAREEKSHEPTARVRIVDSLCPPNAHKISEGSHSKHE